MSELDKYKEAISTGADLIGSISGGVLGALLAGPVGAAIGSAAGTGIGLIINKMGSEIAQRTLSKRENIRIGACTAFAAEKIDEYLKNGYQPRIEFKNENIKTVELLESIYSKSKEAYEEKKVKHLGCFFANMIFHNEISFEESFHLINIFNKITWEQLLILKAFQLDKSTYWDEQNIKRSAQPREWTILSEINEMIGSNLIRQVQDNGDTDLFWGLGAIKPKKITFTRLGLIFCELFSIKEIEIIQVEYIINYFNSKII